MDKRCSVNSTGITRSRSFYTIVVIVVVVATTVAAAEAVGRSVGCMVGWPVVCSFLCSFLSATFGLAFFFLLLFFLLFFVFHLIVFVWRICCALWFSLTLIALPLLLSQLNTLCNSISNSLVSASICSYEMDGFKLCVCALCVCVCNTRDGGTVASAAMLTTISRSIVLEYCVNLAFLLSQHLFSFRTHARTQSQLSLRQQFEFGNFWGPVKVATAKKNLFFSVSLARRLHLSFVSRVCAAIVFAWHLNINHECGTLNGSIALWSLFKFSCYSIVA